MQTQTADVPATSGGGDDISTVKEMTKQMQERVELELGLIASGGADSARAHRVSPKRSPRPGLLPRSLSPAYIRFQAPAFCPKSQYQPSNHSSQPLPHGRVEVSPPTFPRVPAPAAAEFSVLRRRWWGESTIGCGNYSLRLPSRACPFTAIDSAALLRKIEGENSSATAFKKATLIELG